MCEWKRKKEGEREELNSDEKEKRVCAGAVPAYYSAHAHVEHTVL